jgi:hypothetical protein
MNIEYLAAGPSESGVERAEAVADARASVERIANIVRGLQADQRRTLFAIPDSSGN